MFHGILVNWGQLLTILALIWIIAATWLAYAAGLPISVNAGDETRQVFFDFQPIERDAQATFRWTSSDSRICFDQLGSFERAALRLDLLGGYALPLGVESVTLLANDQPVANLPLTAPNRRYHLLLDPQLASTTQPCLGFASTLVSPPGETRQIGVPVVGASLHPLAEAGSLRPAPIQLLLNLALALVLMILLTQLGLRPPWPALLIVAGTTLLLVALLLGWLSPGLALSRSQLPLVLGLALLTLSQPFGHWLDQRLPRQRYALLLGDLLGIVGWAIALWGVTRFFQWLQGVSGMWPFKAGVLPVAPSLLIVPLVGFTIWLALVLWVLEPAQRLRPWAIMALIFGGALGLPVILKASVRGSDSLFATFTNNPFEYISDVPLIGNDPLGFLARYNELIPQLSLHGSTHPPGNALLLWLVEQGLGAGPQPASWVAITLSATLPLAAFWLGTRLGGLQLGLLAGALAVVMPGHQIYSVTSMDGVFNAILTWGAALFLVALEPGARPRLAVLAGMVIGLGLFFTFAATQLAFFGLAVLIAAIIRQRALHGPTVGWQTSIAVPLRQSLLAAGVIGSAYLLIWLVTGYNVVAGAIAATAHNATVMRGFADEAASRAFVPPSLAYYTLHLLANLLPFAWYLGPWGLQASHAGGRHALAQQPWTGLASLSLATIALVGGMLLSGLFNREVERIWSFVYPLAAVLIASHALRGASPFERRWRAALYLGLFVAQSMFIRVNLNTFW